MNKLILIIILLSGILSCEKNDPDYRDNYTGNYTFMIEKISRTLTGDVFVMRYDTSFYTGSVKKATSPDEIAVNWSNDSIDIEGGASLDRSHTIMTIDENGNLDCDVNDDAFWKPAYIHSDTIRFTFYCGKGMAHKLWIEWNVTGLKN